MSSSPVGEGVFLVAKSSVIETSGATRLGEVVRWTFDGGSVDTGLTPGNVLTTSENKVQRLCHLHQTNLLVDEGVQPIFEKELHSVA